MSLLNISTQTTSFPHIRRETSEISRTNSLIKKIILVAKLVIILPLLVVKDSAYYLRKNFKRKVEKYSLFDKVFLASYSKIKNRPLIAKTALVGSFLLGAFYSYPHIQKLLSGNLTSDNKYLMPQSVTLSAVGVGILLLLFLKGRKSKEYLLTQKISRVEFFNVSNVRDLEHKYEMALKCIEEARKLRFYQEGKPKEVKYYLHWLESRKKYLGYEYELARLKIRIEKKERDFSLIINEFRDKLKKIIEELTSGRNEKVKNKFPKEGIRIIDSNILGFKKYEKWLGSIAKRAASHSNNA